MLCIPTYKLDIGWDGVIKKSAGFADPTSAKPIFKAL